MTPDAHAEISAVADNILDLRSRISPAFEFLVAEQLFEENRDFVEWDKTLWDLHDALLRLRGRLESPEDFDVEKILEEARVLMARVPDLQKRVGEFSSRPWWSEVEFRSA